MAVGQINQSTVNFENNKPKKVKNHGVVAGTLVNSGIVTGASAGSLGLLRLMQKVSQVSEADSVILSQAAKEGLKRTGLADKGVEIFKMAGEELKPAYEVLEKEVSSNKLIQKLLNSKNPRINDIGTSAKKYLKNFYGRMIKNGQNAAFFPNANKIITPKGNLETSVFHKMGHAMNFNGGGILKKLQGMRGLSKFAPFAILAIALFNKRKTTDEKGETKLQRFNDFVKRNAGKLTSLAFVPMVLEEGIASLRGQKLAKQFVKEGTLSKNLLKKIRLTNAGGFATYALTMIVAGVAAKAAVDIKDKIQAKHEQKVMNK